ncbi:CapA family protein [Sphingomonas sp. So64.6b]|uniref:CapA family protein n=1 Tax=Sphingomonas sp. So64.6b TaxID=2997354 RepID=UPI0015FEF787|nr:CapA family protein [Sphingomonas sp. So64.6b]QNA83171.1 CapA family protein [Sphingomonas sp. So64.6b]
MRDLAKRLFPLALALAATAVITPAARAQASEPSKDPGEFLNTSPKPMTIKAPFSVVSVGDVLYAHPLAAVDDPEFRKVLALLRSGDVAIANQEGVFIDLATFRGEAYGHGQLWGEGTLPADIKALGIDMVSVAGNHATDFGSKGLMETLRLLDAAGVTHAGSGPTLTHARSAGLLNTPKGVVGLVATASTFKVNAGANDAYPEGETPARPGINALRTNSIILVNAGQLATVRRLATELASPLDPAPAADAIEISFGERTYRLSDRKGLHYDMDLYDHAGLLKSVREAKERAGLVAFTIHAHESATGVDDDTPEPPDFLIRLFHDAVDAGADMVMGGGPHALRGVEIYKGRPILYGLGIFLFKADIKALQETVFRAFPPLQAEMPDPRPNSPRSWFDSVLAVTDFDGGRARRVRLYPIDLMNEGSVPSRRGIPHRASGANAQRILKKLQEDSVRFGTRITIEGDVGLIRIP